MDECTCGKIPYQWARLVDPECKAIHHDETHGYHTADGEPVFELEVVGGKPVCTELTPGPSDVYKTLPGISGNYASLPDADEMKLGEEPFSLTVDVAPNPTVHHDETHGYHTADGEPVADVVERLNDYMNRLRQEREHTAFLEAENTRLRERIEDVRDCFHEDSDAWKNLTEALEGNHGTD